MGVVIWIRGATRGWPELLANAPRNLVHPRGQGWVLATSGESTTGLQLDATANDLALELPLFCGAHELALAEKFVPMIAASAGGRIEIGGQIVAASMYGTALEQIAPQLIDASILEIPKILAAPGSVRRIEGWRRPYFLGALTLTQLQRRFSPDELFEHALAAIAAMQAYPADKVAPLVVVERDGANHAVATWDVTEERLIPPCSELVIRHGADVCRVPHARLSEVIPPHGARLDDLHWLVCRPPIDDVAALMRRARGAIR